MISYRLSSEVSRKLSSIVMIVQVWRRWQEFVKVDVIHRIPAEEISFLVPLAEESTVTNGRVIRMMHVVIV